ncbi:MAG: hypothetical protein BRC28_02850 [Nanohaloarchaea archaeon SW_4_43_9]|nr:MAG: hypothetical protein BRC28_02850 [Nanohaloarchaea archaeon SW_4_43_9]
MRKTEFFRTALLVTVLVILTAPALGDTNYTANSTNVEIGNQVENNLSDTEQRDGVNWKVQEEDTSGVIDILGEDNLEVDVDFDQVSEENKITKITFIHEGKTTGETFDWRIFNYNTGSYENVSFSVDKNSLDYDAYSICETGECNKFDDPLNYISSNGLTETRFVDTDQSSGTQDNMSLNFQAVEITTDDTPPDIRNVSQNYSIITNDTSNLLEAEGYDNFNLSHAVLETNETGNFENKTSSYGSPEAYYTQQNWNETSFEWKNGSIEEEKTVQWRIWYNDTSGNFNATEANSFIVRPNINYSKNISVSFNYTTLTERNFTGNRELSQTISTADNQTRILDLNRSKRETINYSETPNRSQNFKKNQKTSLKADNIQPRNTDNSRAFITGASLSDPGARLSGVERIFSQAISVDEGIREQINKLKYSDTVSREGLFQRILKQTYTVSNNGVRRFVGDRLLTQSIDYSDNQKISSVLERNFNQALALGEISTNTVFNFREVSDRLNINQVYTRNTQTARIFSETADFNSNFIRSNTLQRAFEDIYSQDPDEARIFTGARIVRQTLTGNTQNFRSLTQLRLDETITGFLDDQTRRSILQRSAPVVDILQSDRSSRSLLSLRIQDASFGILTPQSRTFTGARLLAESFLTADDQISASSLTRTDETTFSLTGGFARTYSGSRLFSNTFSAIISASRTGETEREEGFSTEIGSTETRTSFLERIDIASANYDTASLRVRNLIRDVFVQVRPDSQTTRTKRFLRIQKNSLDILTLEEDIFKGERALAETLQTADNQVSASKLGRIYETPASITGSFRRSFTGSRFIQSAFFKDSDTTRKGNVERLDTFNTELGQATSKTVLNLRDQLEELSLKDGITRETTASRLFQQKITSNNQETITSKLARATGQILLPGTSTTRTTSTNRLDTVTTAYSTVSIRISDILRNQVLQIKSESQTTRDIAVSRARDTGLGIIAPQSRSFTGTRILTENFFTEDSQLSDSNLKRTDLTTAAFTGSFTRSFAGSRIISDIFSQDSETSRALQNLRENSLNTAIGSETTRTVINLRDRLESFTINQSNTTIRYNYYQNNLNKQIRYGNRNLFISHCKDDRHTEKRDFTDQTRTTDNEKHSSQQITGR